MASPISKVNLSTYQNFLSSQNYYRGTPSPNNHHARSNPANKENEIDRLNKNLSTPGQSTVSEPWPRSSMGSRSDIEELGKMTLDQINRELDQNINELVHLMNRRRSLVQAKRIRICDEFNRKLDDINRIPLDQLLTELKTVDDETIKKLTQDSEQLQRVSGIIGDPSATNRKRGDELSRSQEFWNVNKGIETEIDQLLQGLKHLDKELLVKNEEIKDECHKLDDFDDRIRDLLIHKSQDSLSRAEPIFTNKQKLQDQLNMKLKAQNALKQEKISKIAKIINLLRQLMGIREQRYKSIKLLVCEGSDISEQDKYQSLMQKFEMLATLQDRVVNLEGREASISNELDKQQQICELLFSDVVKKSSEEARIYSEWTEGLRKRLRYHKVLSYYSQLLSNKKCFDLDIKAIQMQIKESVTYLKPLTEETNAIKAGIQKTEETTKTFQDILNALSNENLRRKEILAILEQCSYLRSEEESKTEQLRQVELEIVKKSQQRKHLQEDLENVLGDADLSTFRKLENLMNNFEAELSLLHQTKNSIQQELSKINQDVFQEIDLIMREFRDILNDILPVNWVQTYDLKKTQHLKLIKTQLKKTLKRIGNID